MKLQDVGPIKSSLKLAQTMSFLSTHPDFRLGAVLVKNGKIISKAFNCGKKSHPYIHRNGEFYNQTIHAELACILKVKNKERLQGATIIVYRERRDGHMANAKPCPMCEKLIRSYGIKKIIYSTEFGFQRMSVSLLGERRDL